MKFRVSTREELEDLKERIACGDSGGLLYCWDNVPKYFVVHNDLTVSEITEYRFNWTFSDYKEIAYCEYLELIGVAVG